MLKSHPDFYSAYYTARVIVDTGGSEEEEVASNGEGSFFQSQTGLFSASQVILPGTLALVGWFIVFYFVS
jgi:hypothetical protein